jgi:hypothetical protein
VVLSTAHPAKFPEAVSAAAGLTPATPRATPDLSEARKFDRLPADAETVKAFVRVFASSWFHLLPLETGEGGCEAGRDGGVVQSAAPRDPSDRPFAATLPRFTGEEIILASRSLGRYEH